MTDRDPDGWLLDHIGRFSDVWVTSRLDIARHCATRFPSP